MELKKTKVDLKHGVIHYSYGGTGRTIVLLHGLFLSGAIWDRVIREFPENVNIIVPEFPFGSHKEPMNESADLSPVGAAKLLADFLQALNLDDVTLVGMDFGAVVAKVATARFGSRIERLVITNCDALEVFPAKGFEYFAWLPRIPAAMFLLAQSMYRFSAVRGGKTSYGAFTINPIPDDILKSFVEPMARSKKVRRDASKMMLGIDKELTLSLPEELKKSGKKILVLWGNEDHLFTIGLARRLVTAIGNDTKLVEIDNAKMIIAFDSPIETSKAILNFAL